MTKDEIISQLKEMGDPRAIKIWEKMNMDTSNYLGVGLTKIKKFAKKIKKNHVLSEELWETGIRDARLLSFAIADPQQLSKANLSTKVKELDFWDLTDNFCSFLVAKSNYGAELADQWRYSNVEMIKRSAFVTVAGLAKTKTNLTDDYFDSYLAQIKKEIRSDKNWVKEGMIYALMGIGARNENLNKAAIAVCEAVGKIVVDYGETSCVTPDPLKYLIGERVKAKITS